MATTVVVCVTAVTMETVVKVDVTVVKERHVILSQELVIQTVRRDGLDRTATEVSTGSNK